MCHLFLTVVILSKFYHPNCALKLRSSLKFEAALKLYADLGLASVVNVDGCTDCEDVCMRITNIIFFKLELGLL
jgi:hypothetical protein